MTDQPKLFVIECKDGPRAKWKRVAYPPMPREKADELADELAQYNVVRVVELAR